jgi:hypothetical protein
MAIASLADHELQVEPRNDTFAEQLLCPSDLDLVGRSLMDNLLLQ